MAASLYEKGLIMLIIHVLIPTHRMVADMGKVLDWFTEMAAEKKWKVMRVNLGPCKNLLVGLHPDALKVLLKSGLLMINTVIAKILVFMKFQKTHVHQIHGNIG